MILEHIDISLLFWCLAWILSAAGDSINFRPTESIWSKIKNTTIRQWILGHYKYWLRNKYPYLPMIADFWHFAKWLKWACLFNMLYFSERILHWEDIFLYMFSGFVVFQLFYHKIFVNLKVRKVKRIDLSYRMDRDE